MKVHPLNNTSKSNSNIGERSALVDAFIAQNKYAIFSLIEHGADISQVPQNLIIANPEIYRELIAAGYYSPPTALTNIPRSATQQNLYAGTMQNNEPSSPSFRNATMETGSGETNNLRNSITTPDAGDATRHIEEGLQMLGDNPPSACCTIF